jgi:hypothetical protein
MLQTQGAMQPERAAFDVLESTPELLARIFAYLDTDEDLARACAVKRSWLASAGADGLWQARCAQSFPLASALKLRTGSTLSYRRLLAQRRASQSVARATPPPPVAQQPNRQDYLLGIEIRKIGSVALYDSVQPITGGAVMFSALVDLDEQGQGPSPLVVDEQSLVASVRGGSTGAVLRAGNCEEEAEPGGAVRGSWSSWDGDYIRHYGDDDGNWGLDLKFHVDAFLVRKSDGETLSLCAGTSAYDSQNWPGGEGGKDMDSLARRPDYELVRARDDDTGNGKWCEYCWLVPGTGTAYNGHPGISILAARLVLRIESGLEWKNEREFYALAKLPSSVPEFEDDDDRSSEEVKADWVAEHQYWEVAVTSVSLSLRKEDEEGEIPEKRCERVGQLLGLLEEPLLRRRWV